MTRLIKTAVSIAFVFTAQAAIACDYPNRILIPNGNTATKEDMLEGQRAVKQFVTEMEAYLQCIEDEEAAARMSMVEMSPEEEEERETVFNKKYNAAVDEMERTAAQFNAEVQAYRAQGQ
jgi:hypothetical protein